MTKCLALTFHGLEQQGQEEGILPDAASRPYTVASSLFAETARLVGEGPSCTVADLVSQPDVDNTVLTFDDGLISDYDIAFPLLQDQGLTATFFVTAGMVGKSGYVSAAQLREMAEAGMEIGSHGLTHCYLVCMHEAQVHQEIGESRQRLEQMLGCQVQSFAPVGGHFSGAMLAMASQAGYRCFASMIPGVSRIRGNDLVVLRRNHLQGQHDIRYVERLLARDWTLLAKNGLRYQLLYGAKRLLGMQRYDRIKKMLVEGVA